MATDNADRRLDPADTAPETGPDAEPEEDRVIDVEVVSEPAGESEPATGTAPGAEPAVEPAAETEPADEAEPAAEPAPDVEPAAGPSEGPATDTVATPLDTALVPDPAAPAGDDEGVEPDRPDDAVLVPDPEAPPAADEADRLDVAVLPEPEPVPEPEPEPVPEPEPEPEPVLLPAGDRLLGDEAAARYRQEWDEIQTAFVDDPRRAAERADALAAEVTQEVTRLLAAQRERVDEAWRASAEPSTEDLRLAVQRYRDLVDRLLER